MPGKVIFIFKINTKLSPKENMVKKIHLLVPTRYLKVELPGL